LVTWPEVHEYMDEQWFYDEAVLAIGIEEKVRPGAFFIPAQRVLGLSFEM